jgi:glycosyltransferase involved in cell wall biosynthesis
MKLIAIILTYNEEKHLPRCIDSLRNVADDILIVDCFSKDKTVEIALSQGARVVQHEWVNYAMQFNWGVTQLEPDTDWVLRIDADEYLTPELAGGIRASLQNSSQEIVGAYCNRRMTFQRRLILHGGVFPVQVLRLFRYGRGQCENRWMDEHIKVNGLTITLKGELIDDNLNSLTWWTDKHNKYACREAIDLLNLEYCFMPHDTVANLRIGNQAGVKRWVKEMIYARLPGGFRAFAYFFYRYVMCLGFLDGHEGTSFHFLQGFWYRYLVDMKVAEVKRCMHENDLDVINSIEKILEVRIHDL